MFLICFFCKFSALVSIDNQYFTRNQQIMKKKIGMEAVYVDGDLRFGSGITEYYPNGDPTGVDMTEATVKQIKSVDFYDLSGRKLSAPAKGICIRTITYTDGSKASRKIVK
ncbi:MAG: hypothetical protein MR386_08100 [Prevotella sp.]|nr:hypothetical protein [Prevotella sp.]